MGCYSAIDKREHIAECMVQPVQKSDHDSRGYRPNGRGQSRVERAVHKVWSCSSAITRR